MRFLAAPMLCEILLIVGCNRPGGPSGPAIPPMEDRNVSSYPTATASPDAAAVGVESGRRTGNMAASSSRATSACQHGLNELSEDRLLELAHVPIACSDISTEQIVGCHRGVPVRVSVRCGDVCPGQEFRIVEYAVALDRCTAMGGAIRKRGVPIALAIRYVDTCVPAILSTDDAFGFGANAGRRPCFWPVLTDEDLRGLSRLATSSVRESHAFGEYHGHLVSVRAGCPHWSADSGHMSATSLSGPIVEYIGQYPKEASQCAEFGGILRWPCGHDWPPSCVPVSVVDSLPNDPPDDMWKRP